MNRIYTLSRDEVLRGFSLFEQILSNPARVQENYLSAFFDKSGLQTDFPVKVGFLVSKKKSKKRMNVIV